MNGSVIENVAWNCASLAIKGDHHTIEKNTVFDMTNEATETAMFVMMYCNKSWAIKGENSHTKLEYNAADSIFNVSGVLPGIAVDNVVGTPIRAMLLSPDTYDFRPKPGSVLERTGAGAYASSVAHQWIPGVEGVGGNGVACEYAGCLHWKALRTELGIAVP